MQLKGEQKMAVIELNNGNFDNEISQSDLPVIVDFWAEWCGPCKRLSPIVEQLSTENTNIKFCKVNIDEQPDLASRFHIMSIPTLIAFQNGRVHNTSVGLIPKNEILNLIK